MDLGEGAPVGPVPEGDRVRSSTTPHGASADKGRSDEPAQIQPNKHRDAQLARTGERKLFDKKARKAFLNWFAATGNVVWSAEKAGFDDSTVWRHRMNDPRFAEAFDRAFEQSVVRNKAKMLERRIKEKPIEIDGGIGEAELEDCDPCKAWPLIVEIERAKGRGEGTPMGRPRKAGRPPRVASNAEVRRELEKRLRAYSRRLRAAGREPPPWLPPAEGWNAGARVASPAAPPPAPPPPFGWSPSPAKAGEDEG